jgi:hypothetical protein
MKYMKVKFMRKFVTHKYGTSLTKTIEGDSGLDFLWLYLRSEVGYYESCSLHLEEIRKIQNEETEGWGDGGNSCSSWITKNGVIIEYEYALLPENNTISLSLDQFKKAITGWKTFLENESLMEYEVDI